MCRIHILLRNESECYTHHDIKQSTLELKIDEYHVNNENYKMKNVLVK